MEDVNLLLLRALSSEKRRRIIECIREGKEHPEDMTENLKISRQAIDRHLKGLQRFGVVRTVEVPSRGPRDKRTYRLTEIGNKLIDGLDRLIGDYYKKFAEEVLETKLLTGGISEKTYRRLLCELAAKGISGQKCLRDLGWMKEEDEKK